MTDHMDPLPSGEDSPWAHDVPISPPPFFPTAWMDQGRGAVDSRDDARASSSLVMRRPSTPSSPPPPRSSPPPRLSPPQGSDEPVGGGPPTRAAPGRDKSGAPLTRRRRSVLVGGVLGVVAIAAIGTQVIGGDGSRPEGMRAGVNEGATFDSQVWFPDTEPPPSTTRPLRQPTTTVATLPKPEPQWVTTQFELDPSVRAMTLPTEVIALTESGTLISISIPSGEVHSIETEGFSSDTGLVLGARAIVLQSYAASTSTLARVGLPLTSIDVPTGLGFVVGRPGGDEFVVFANQVSPSSIATPFLLSGDGTLTEIVDGPFADTNAGASRFLPTGETIVFDTGGLYVVDASGASRLLTSGDLVATGPNHYLLRECDEDRNCGYVRVDAVTGDRSAVTLDPTVDYSNASLAPDGSVMSYVEFGDEAPLQRIVDLSTGAMTELDTARSYDFFGPTGNMWAADSSGVFAINNTQLTFFDRATGVATPVVPNVNFGDIVVVAARPLAAPATP